MNDDYYYSGQYAEERAEEEAQMRAQHGRLLHCAPDLLRTARAALYYMKLHKYADQAWADDLAAVIDKIDGKAAAD